jgi:hypothetical protein
MKYAQNRGQRTGRGPEKRGLAVQVPLRGIDDVTLEDTVHNVFDVVDGAAHNEGLGCRRVPPISAAMV